MKHLIFLLIAIVSIPANSQTTAKIIDATTGESIPYANIQCNSETLISNAEGFFTISDANSSDNASITVSYIGYVTVQMTVSELKSKQNVVKMPPAVFELDDVRIREQPSPEAIMATVRKNLKTNYSAGTNSFETKIFIRESRSFNAKKLDIELDKSTGFSKSALKSFNTEMDKFTSRAIANPTKAYTDILFNYYKSGPKNTYKIDVAKATKLLDKNRSASIEGMQESAMALFLKHLDTTKYYRIKSGWFGSRDTVSLRKDFKKNKKAEPKSELTSLKANLGNTLAETSLLSTAFEFIHEPKIYNYKSEGSVLLPDGNFAYVITFTPDRSRAIYKGKLYISENDFAVVRADYQLVEGKKAGGMNLKLLLGVKFAENLKTGTMIYRQRPSGDGYYLQYASKEDGNYFYLNRPLKFIELAEDEKDVVAFDLKIEGTMYERVEYLNLSRSEISEADFDAAKEKDFKYTAVNKYDPTMWKDVAAIEPLEEMKRFKASDEPQ